MVVVTGAVVVVAGGAVVVVGGAVVVVAGGAVVVVVATGAVVVVTGGVVEVVEYPWAAVLRVEPEGEWALRVTITPAAPMTPAAVKRATRMRRRESAMAPTVRTA